MGIQVIPQLRYKTDGSNQKEQYAPQTTIKAVNGLPAKLDLYETLLSRITGYDVNTGKKITHIVTESDLANFVTKDDLKAAVSEVKKYTDDSVKNIMDKFSISKLFNGTNIDLLTTTGIYYKPKDISVNGLPPYNTINQSGILIVINGPDGRLFQKWISMDITVYEYSRVPNYPLTNPIKWGSWNYK